MSAVSNAKWVAVSQVARILSQLANIFVLARILPPSDYGLMAMATVITNFALLLRDQGTSAAIIQKESLSHKTINTVFWFNLIIAILITFSIIVSSPFIASYFKHDELIPILIILSLIFPISSSSISHQAILERESQFKRLAYIEFVASIVAMIVSIIAALFGAGVYSLVLQSVVMAVLLTIQIWVISAWRPMGKPSLKELKELLPFTGHMTAFQFITYFFRNADSIVVGRVLGAMQLGIYSMAYKVMLLPVQNITWAASRALFPVMSRQQNAPEQMGKLLIQTIGGIAFITAPLMAGVYGLRELFVEVAFGPNWTQVANILAWLAPVGFIQSISSTSGVVFMAQGKTKLLMWISLLGAAIHIAAYVIGSQFGAVGVAEWYFYASAITFLITLTIVARLTSCSLMRVFIECLRPVIISLGICIILRYSLHYDDFFSSNIFELLTLSIISLFLYLFSYYIFFKDVLIHYYSSFLVKR